MVFFAIIFSNVSIASYRGSWQDGWQIGGGRWEMAKPLFGMSHEHAAMTPTDSHILS